jgi:hypothetical protein
MSAIKRDEDIRQAELLVEALYETRRASYFALPMTKPRSDANVSLQVIPFFADLYNKPNAILGCMMQHHGGSYQNPCIDALKAGDGC